MAAPLATLTGMNALEMDSEGRVVEVVLGTEFLTMTDERAIIKLGLKLVQAVRTESPSKRQFGSLFFAPFITL